MVALRTFKMNESATNGSHATGNHSTDILAQFSLKDKVIVITGGGRGLGLNFGLAMAEVGAHIACVDIHEKPHEDFYKLASFGIRSGYYRTDVRDYEKLKATIDKVAGDFGSVDGCVPAAGIIRNKPFMEHTPQDMSDTIDINLNGVFSTVQLCAAQMIKQGTGGNIVCISSVAGHKGMTPQTCSAYVASKWAVRGLVKQIAGELAVHKIRCNSISPGTIQTDMLEGVMRENPGHRKLFNDSNVLRRLAKPGELNAAMIYLMSKASSYVTGNDLLVDGGICGLLT